MSCRTTYKPGSKCFFLSWTTLWGLRYGRERAVWQDQTHWECESHSWKHTGPLGPTQACSSIHPFHFMMNAATPTQHYGLVDRRIPLSVLWPVDEGSVEGLELFLKRRSSYWLKRTRLLPILEAYVVIGLWGPAGTRFHRVIWHRNLEHQHH